MFDSQRYATQGITKSIPQHLQNLLWFMIETMPVQEKDRLQVFELDPVKVNGQIKQKVVHKQEQPPYMTENAITVREAVTAKIFVIDDGPHSTMLLAEEY